MRDEGLSGDGRMERSGMKECVRDIYNTAGGKVVVSSHKALRSDRVERASQSSTEIQLVGKPPNERRGTRIGTVIALQAVSGLCVTSALAGRKLEAAKSFVFGWPERRRGADSLGKKCVTSSLDPWTAVLDWIFLVRDMSTSPPSFWIAHTQAQRSHSTCSAHLCWSYRARLLGHRTQDTLDGIKSDPIHL